MATRGDLTEAAVLHAFVAAGLDVFVPWRNDLPYDLVVTLDGQQFFRVQCKSGRVRGGCLDFNSRSTDHGSGQRDYRGLADVFAIACPALDETFVVPVDTAGRSLTSLRLVPALNNQVRRTRLAADHTVGRWVESLRVPAAA